MHLVQAYSNFLGMLSSDSVLATDDIFQLIANPDKLQSRLTADIANNDLKLLYAVCTDEKVLARLRSVSGKGAGAWLQAVPTIDELALNPCEFRIAVCLRLGLPLPFCQWITTCDCKASLDDLGFHLLTCKKGGELVWAHDSVVAGWSSCLRELDIHHKKE